MPQVGNRKSPNMGNITKDPMYAYAKAFCETQQNMLHETRADYAFEPVKALSYQENRDALENFFVENSLIGDKNNMTQEQYEDHVKDMKELFINDVQAVQENATVGLAQYNPMVGISLPMHKYLMLNCVYAQAIPRFVAKTPSWTETMETRFMVTPDGKRIDIANQQNEIYAAWKSANRPIEVAISLPEAKTVDILNDYFHVPRVDHHLSVATHICAVAVEEFVKAGAPVLTIDAQGVITEGEAAADGVAIVWKPWKAEFTPGYGEYDKIITQPVDIVLATSATETAEFHDTIFASWQDDMFEINSGGKIKAVKMWARYDASSRQLKTNRVEWQERTTFVQIPENDGITVPITPEEVKDIGAQYGINQVTKYMSMIKDVLENVKDDDIHHELDDSFRRLPENNKLARTVDFAPREGYYSDHLEWLQKTFMNTLDNYITGLLTVLRDPNMEISIIGRPAIIRQITPVEYSYQAPSNLGSIELNFKKTVVTSDKRIYNFISSDKLFGNDSLTILLNPRQSSRVVYRLYDYQFYVSNEVRDAANPALPALTAFQRYKFFEYQGVQGRLFVANPTGIREFLPTPTEEQIFGYDEGSELNFANNDLGSVFGSYSKDTGLNEAPATFGE